MRFKDFSTAVIGPARKMTLEHRMLNISNLAGACFSLIIGLSNFYLKLPLFLIGICLGVFVIMATLYVLGRFYTLYNPLVLPSVLCMLVVTAGSFLLNGGTHGGSQYFLFSAALCSTIITLPRYRGWTVVTYIFSITLLLFLEFTYPELVIGYPSERARQIDIWVSMVNSVLATCAVGFFLFENYRLYRRLIVFEQRRSNTLLRNMLPRSIFQKLLKGDTMVSESIPESTVLFADIVGFTAMAGQLPAEKIVQGLNQLYADFDRLASRFHVEKIKTIGDAWMGVAGMPSSAQNHADACLNLAKAMNSVVKHFNLSGYPIRLRIGMHSGPIVCGTIGRKRIQFDVWGHTVNVASRLEESCPPCTIRWSEQTHKFFQTAPETAENLGVLEFQGLEPMTVYQLSS